MEDKPTAGDRGAIRSRSAWYLSELVRHLEEVVQSTGRAVDIPEPLFFADLLRILHDLGIEPAVFFHGVIRRWACGGQPLTG
jgi:hypothetical protein